MNLTLQERWDRIYKHTLVIYSSGTQVPTSPKLIREMISHLPECVLRDTRALFLDPVCGRGTFLAELFILLMSELESIIPNEATRARNIVARLCGSDVNQMQIDIARRMLGDLVKCYGVDRSDLRLKCVDSLVYDWNVKFDVVCGNPPFQPETSRMAGAGSGNMIWPDFVIKALSLMKSDGHIIFITPSNWRDGSIGKGNTKTARQMMWELGICWYMDVRIPFDHFAGKVGQSISIDAWHVSKSQVAIDIAPSLKAMYLLPSPLMIAKFNTFFTKCQSSKAIPFLTRDISKPKYKSLSADDVRTVGLWPHANTSAQHNRGEYDWDEKKPTSFREKKVIVSDSGEFAPRYDAGTCGLGHHAYAYVVSSKIEAERLISNIEGLMWIAHEFAPEGNFSFPTHLYTHLPRELLTKSWQEVFNFD